MKGGGKKKKEETQAPMHRFDTPRSTARLYSSVLHNCSWQLLLLLGNVTGAFPFLPSIFYLIHIF